MFFKAVKVLISDECSVKVLLYFYGARHCVVCHLHGVVAVLGIAVWGVVSACGFYKAVKAVILIVLQIAACSGGLHYVCYVVCLVIAVGVGADGLALQLKGAGLKAVVLIKGEELLAAVA